MDTDGAVDRRTCESDNAVEAMETQEIESLEVSAEIDNLSSSGGVGGNNGDTVMMTCAEVASSQMIEDTNMEEDEVRSEATFRFRVEKFSKLTDSVLSPPCYVRNLPWKIMVMPRNGGASDRPTLPESRTLGFFLQCNGDSDSTSWSCHAAAELRIHTFKTGEKPFTRKIKHVFYSKENDWGFSHFLSWNEILDPEKCYIQNDSILLEVYVTAEAPHGVFWDSKKHTGCVGLKNQGATCYMNSLLQTLYFTNHLRKAVYKMPTEADDSSKSVALALQRVFHDLQFNDKPVGTKKLTKSFGWETLDSFMQHDVQEFLRVLLDKLESKMKGTCVEGTVPGLFEGKMSSYIKCKNIDYSSKRTETFYDIQLNIKGKKNIYESFKDYVAPEMLEGDNKYDAGEHGMQEAEKGVIFVKFPPVLHLHLMRFQYDPITDNSVKFNDRFEFYERINLDSYLQERDDTPADYILHAVLVHSGDNHGGHYVVYINPVGDGKWCKFDDDVVSRCIKDEAITNNYGGIDDEMSLNAKHCSNAYMLVYIRDSALPTVLQTITEDDIPLELVERLNEEKRMELVRRRERAEAGSYMIVNVLLEEHFQSQTIDFCDIEKAHFRVFKIKKSAQIQDLLATFVDTFGCPLAKMRLWPVISRFTQIMRPTYFNYMADLTRSVANCADVCNPWYIFLEMMQPCVMRFPMTALTQQNNLASVTTPTALTGTTTSTATGTTKSANTNATSTTPLNATSIIDTPATWDQPIDILPTFHKDTQVLLFYKCYDSIQKQLHYCGLGYYTQTVKLAALLPDLNRRAGYSLTTPLTVYWENGLNAVQKLLNMDETLGKQIANLLDGDSIIFERELIVDEQQQQQQQQQTNQQPQQTQNQQQQQQQQQQQIDNIQLPTCKDYFEDLLYRVDVTFVDKNNPNDNGFVMELSLHMTYDQMAQAVGQKINVNPYQIQFFRCQSFKDIPGPALRYTYDLNLREVLAYSKSKTPKRIFYLLLSMNINELENKKQFKCLWLSANMKEEKELVLYPNKNGTVRTLLEEATKQVEFAEDGTHKLRLCEVCGHKLMTGPSLDTPLEQIQSPSDTNMANQKIYRIEEIPRDELQLAEDEILIAISHFYKDVYNAFGIPFFIRAKEGEPFAVLKERIHKRLCLPDKEWEKYKFALISMGRPEFLADDFVLNFTDFRMIATGPQSHTQRPYIGLEHINKSQKRSRFNYLEKAIKIYN